MSCFDSIVKPTLVNVLVSFIDLSHFAVTCQKMTDLEIFQLMSEYFAMSGSFIEKAGGKFVKPIGDAALIIFPEELAEEGILALRQLKIDSDEWMKKRGLKCRLIVKIHVGPVVCGRIGAPGNLVFDVYGNTVNGAALVKSNGFAMTPQAFRKLTGDSRKFFKKHTPAVTYIGIEEKHGS